MTNRKRAMEVGVVISIIILAFMLRMYHIDRLAVLLSDQAIDSFVVKDILAGHFTLLGPRASVGQFFNGPIVYYLMVPFYFFFHSDPLAGTFFQITFQIATIPLLYLLAKSFGGKKAGLISIIIFAFSPLLIGYSRAAFNAYPAIFFTTIILYLITKTNLSSLVLFVAGLCAGMLVQMHYFLYVYALGYFIYTVIQSKNIKQHISFLIGSTIGLSPFLLFELRHEFFNVRAILSSGGSVVDHASILDRVLNVGTAIGSLLGVAPSVALVIILFLCFRVMKKDIDVRLRLVFLISLSALFVSLILYKGVLQNHYLIGLMMIFVVTISSIVARIFSSRALVFLSTIYVICFFMFQRGLFIVPADQDGLGLADERVTASLISHWKKTNISWNITQDAQRDNRAMPLRYLISLDKSLPQPLPVEDYQSNKELFVVVPHGKKIRDISTWEVQAFGSDYRIIRSAVINPKYSLYYLRK
jgi:4-amino-4-deoxy-L-arabinose transferase-like glycosyltransferase